MQELILLYYIYIFSDCFIKENKKKQNFH